ncbi:unnamed protein product [Sphagnum tenellum]
MESPAPSVNSLALANDGKVDKVFHESLDSRLVPISVNKTLPMWEYFAMVKDKLIMPSLWSSMTVGIPSSSNFLHFSVLDRPAIVDVVQIGAWPGRATQAQRISVQRCGHGRLERLRHLPQRHSPINQRHN